MNTSKDLEQQASLEENDIKAMALHIKALREKRSERFIEDWLPILQDKYSVIHKDHKYTITTQKFGIVDYFPKANKLLIRQDNKWIKPGLKFIINNFFNN